MSKVHASFKYKLLNYLKNIYNWRGKSDQLVWISVNLPITAMIFSEW